jgi:hypothetical protein
VARVVAVVAVIDSTRCQVRFKWVAVKVVSSFGARWALKN